MAIHKNNLAMNISRQWLVKTGDTLRLLVLTEQDGFFIQYSHTGEFTPLPDEVATEMIDK